MSDDAPQFTGITRYHDLGGRFSFRYPWDWSTESLDEGRDGVMLTPEANDPGTYVAAWVSRLPTVVSADDLPELRDAFDSGLGSLPELHVLEAHEDAVGGAVTVMRTVMFRDAEYIRQRCIRSLWAGETQLVFVYQGATPRAYEYWLSMSNYCWATLELAEEIWYSADPELSRPRQS
ncbi:hypothetical protein [Kribbella sp. VKM Ac-2566]|uniref:hypothetical protein n=1 Tax=Kribbella sp. VKM Ac-2566 TaxID=2512218 RepID=UPI001062B352|nr:hypothetical protein [Kribbella sp. VKM Ac-2566]TDW79424.1 hypothetical protein EV647_8228 [Kribbella sp. VKM Ac-2566]